ncbi:MAG TPA: hypothetical protein VM187_12870 [Niastella sp.]|nr:hypothetical protein [Niastella sp.]
MIFIKKHIITIMLCIAGIIMGIFIASLFAKKPSTSNATEAVSKAYQEAIKAKDETIGLLRENNTALDDRIAAHQKTDSLLLAKLTTNQPKYITNDKKLQEVVTATHSLDTVHLKWEYANYSNSN